MNKLIVTTPEELKRMITDAVQAAMKEYAASAVPDAGARNGAKYLTIDEAADYLSLAKQTLYGFTSNRKIPFIKRAKRLLFTKADLDEWLQQGKKRSVIQLRSVVNSLNGKAA